MKQGKRLILFTASFPYGKGESFLENEVKTLSSRFQQVDIIPYQYNESSDIRSLPENFRVLHPSSYSFKFSLFFFSFPFVFIMILKEFLKGKRGVKAVISETLKATHKALWIEDYVLKKNEKGSIFYSFWFNEWVTALSFLKNKKQDMPLITRIHGYDVFEERREGNYIPFRWFDVKQVDKIFAASNASKNYFKEKYPAFSQKVETSYLGVFDNDENPFQKDAFTLVSCASLVPIKRVGLLLNALNKLDMDITWYHFGDGELRGELEEIAKNSKQHLTCHFMGHVPNSELLKFYQKEPVNLFVHTSNTEGGTVVAIQEAISYGIPVMACRAGGVAEIVNEQTGVLLHQDISDKDLSSEISGFRKSEKNTPEFRKKVKEFWKENFDAQKNYNNFCDRII